MNGGTTILGNLYIHIYIWIHTEYVTGYSMIEPQTGWGIKNTRALIPGWLGLYRGCGQVEKAVSGAIGGVLFIDEAYALVRDGKERNQSGSWESGWSRSMLLQFLGIWKKLLVFVRFFTSILVFFRTPNGFLWIFALTNWPRNCRSRRIRSWKFHNPLEETTGKMEFHSW